jgi:beta-glucuronidase
MLGLTLLWPMGVCAQDLLTNVAHRQTTSLDGAWHYIVDPYETGYYDYRRRPYDQQLQRSNAAFYSNHTH